MRRALADNFVVETGSQATGGNGKQLVLDIPSVNVASPTMGAEERPPRMSERTIFPDSLRDILEGMVFAINQTLGKPNTKPMLETIPEPPIHSEASTHGSSAAPPRPPVPPRGRMRSPPPSTEFVPITANLPIAATSLQRSANMRNRSPMPTPQANSRWSNDHSSVTVPVRGRTPSLSAVPAMLTPPSSQSQTAPQQRLGTSPPPSSDSRLVYPAELATTCRTSATSPFSMSAPVPSPVRRAPLIVSEKASQNQERLLSPRMSSNRSMSPVSVGRGRPGGEPRASSPGFVTTSGAKFPGSRQQSPSPSLTSSTTGNMESETHSVMLGSGVSSHIASVRNQWVARCGSSSEVPSSGVVTTSEARFGESRSRNQSPAPSLTTPDTQMESEPRHSQLLNSGILAQIESVRNQWASRCASTQKTLSLSQPVRSSGPTDEELLRHVRRCVAFQEESSACSRSSTGTPITSGRTRTGPGPNEDVLAVRAPPW